jgi:glutamate-1-semialdehyde 2,1-aminomutase
MVNFIESSLLREKAHRLIPGGCHTYAKGDDQYPELAPGFISSGKGCRVWDVDGNEYIEYGMGLRAVALGHAYAPVVEAAYREMLRGSNFTRPSPIEIACAEEFLVTTGAGEMVKFAKDGSTVNTAAVRLARAFTGRKLVAICAADPFLSYNDWFIGTTAMPAGIPSTSDRRVLKFEYNDATSLERLFLEHPGEIACVMFELERTVPPSAGFLNRVQELCRAHGALLIADEMITGFRLHLGGAQGLHGVEPDLSTFGKALANGFAVSALAGRREIMELGGIRHAKERVYLLSTTHGAETHALAAAIATMRTYRTNDVVGHLYRQGARLASGVLQAARANGVDDFFGVAGPPSNLIYVTRDASGRPSQALRALFLQELIRHGVLAPSFVISSAHRDDDVDRTVDAVDKALQVYRKALDTRVECYLVGRPVKPVFRAYC